MSDDNQLRNKSYEQIWREWNDKYAFGAKGEMAPAEAREVHAKWKRLGTEARLGI